MNFDGFGGLALAVVAGLWLMVFVPSWFKRAQDRERGIDVNRPTRKKNKSAKTPARRPSVDNFVALAREYAGVAEEVTSEAVDPRAWQRNALPAPRSFEGTLEVVSLAEVTSLESARENQVSRKLEQHELDEILRRRRANG